MASVAEKLQRALEYHQSGDLQNAEEIYRQIVRVDPRQADALHLLGVAAFQQGRNESALDLITRAIAVEGNSAPYYNNLGNVYQRLGRMDEAVDCYCRVIRISPEFTDAHYNLGVLYKDQGKNEESLIRFRDTLRIHPNHTGALNNQSIVLKELGRLDESIESYQTLLAMDPEFAEGHNNLGAAYEAQENPTKAIECYQRAIDLCPDYAEAHFNLGNVYDIQSQFHQAVTSYQRALEIRPDYADAFCNLGVVQRKLGCVDEAIATFTQALLHDPGHVGAHVNRSHASRLVGDLERGWDEEHWQRQESENRRTFLQPEWDGSILTNEKLLVFADQGVGDEIFHATCLPDVLEKAQRCIVECDPRLVELYQRSFPKAQVFGSADLVEEGASPHLPPYDVQIAAGSLQKTFRRRWEQFPRRERYLIPDSQLRGKWEQRLAALGDGPNIGISWRGGIREEQRRSRSTTLAQWKDILGLPNLSFINLQYGECVEELDEVFQNQGVRIHDWVDADPLTDLDGFAGQIAALDLVISTDNTTVHMAGALGVPVWNLLPFAPEWRWQLNRSDCPWYSSMRLFRQPGLGDWNTVFETVRRSLKELTTSSEKNGQNQFHVSLLPSATDFVVPDLSSRNERPTLFREMKSAGIKGPHTAGFQLKNDDQGVKTENRLRIALLNDTSNSYHWGCTATSGAIRTRLSMMGHEVIPVPFSFTQSFADLPGTIQEFDDPAFFQRARGNNPGLFQTLADVDIVVVNGEGTMHGLSQSSVALLYLMHSAKHFLEKTVHLINQSTYPENRQTAITGDAFQIYQHVYRHLDFIAIREHLSYELMRRSGIEATLSFDCLPITLESFGMQSSSLSEKHLVVGGAAGFDLNRVGDLTRYMRTMHKNGYAVTFLTGAKNHPAVDDLKLVELLKQQSFQNWDVCQAASLEEWFRCLASATLLVSGRFHYSIASAFLHVPCVLFEGNTPKNHALAESFEMEVPLSYENKHFESELLARTERVLAAGTVDPSILNTIRNLSERNFDGLSAHEKQDSFHPGKNHLSDRYQHANAEITGR